MRGILTAPGSHRLYLCIWLLLKAELLGLHQAAAHAVQPHVPTHPKSSLSQPPGWKKQREASSSPLHRLSFSRSRAWPSSSPPWVWISEGSGLSRKGIWGAKPNKNGPTVPFAEGSSPWCRQGGRKGPGLLPSAHLLSAPALTSILVRSGKHKVGDRKTCRDRRAFSHCPSAP